MLPLLYKTATFFNLTLAKAYGVQISHSDCCLSTQEAHAMAGQMVPNDNKSP